LGCTRVGKAQGREAQQPLIIYRQAGLFLIVNFKIFVTGLFFQLKTPAMRLILILLIVPFLAGAQINRSAKELASESIREYVQKKLFKHKPYKPGAFGEIKPIGDKSSDVAWTLAHKFEITEGGEDSFERTAKMQKQYKFLFYLDEKMKVMRAETFYSD
jgi:hypothetical protein